MGCLLVSRLKTTKLNAPSADPFFKDSLRGLRIVSSRTSGQTGACHD